jgi:peptidoglycan/LPS O-acetylase OafA/YrhL
LLPFKSPPLPGRRVLAALTGLRFYAAFLVVAYHFLTPALAWLPPLRIIAERGFVGVGLFFVLSGFILVHVYAGTDRVAPIDRRAFWLARVARVYPVYLLALLLSLPLFVGKQLAEHGATAGTAQATVAIAALAASLTQAWVPAAACRLNCPGWSLSAEALFYALFPLLAALLARRTPRQLLAIALGCWLVALVAPLAYLVLRPDGVTGWEGLPETTWANAVKFFPLAHLPEFVLGVATGRLFVLAPGRIGARGTALAWGAVVAVLLAGDALPVVLLHNGLLAPLFAVGVYGLAHGEGAVARHLGRPALRRLGEGSYALYLLHYPTFAWLKHVLRHLHGPPLETTIPLLVAYAAVAVGVSLLVLWAVEEPARRAIRRRIARRADADVPALAGAT